MQVDFDKAIPIYEQIIDYLKKSMARGEMKPGDKLPSQRKMARKMEVNPNTIQRAYREMEALGLVETQRGKGTFIVDTAEIIKEINREMAEEAINCFITEMKALGFSRSEMLTMLKKRLETGSISTKGDENG